MTDIPAGSRPEHPPGWTACACPSGHRNRETAAVFYAGDDVGDLPAVHAVNAWSGRSGRPKLAVAISPSGLGPLAELADVTGPDPHSLILLLRQIVGGRCSR